MRLRDYNNLWPTMQEINQNQQKYSSAAETGWLRAGESRMRRSGDRVPPWRATAPDAAARRSSTGRRIDALTKESRAQGLAVGEKKSTA